MKNFKNVVSQYAKPIVVVLTILALTFGASSLVATAIAGGPGGFNGGP